MGTVNIALEEISKLISDQGVPTFIKSAQKIAQLTEDNNNDIKDLCDVIMKDAGMSTRLIRASNQAYKVRPGRTNTVSRAIVMLGAKEVRNICLASEVVDGLLKGTKVRKELIHELVRAFFAAVQARHLAIQSRDRKSEEVFVGALVKRLGRIIFWRVESTLVDKLAEALKEPTENPKIIEESVLGFNLDELSEKVIELWGLEKLIPRADSQSPEKIRRSKEVRLSNDLATASLCGWGSEAVKEVYRAIEKELGITARDVAAIINRTTKEACETALSYGLKEAANAIPDVLTPEEIKAERKRLCEEYEAIEPDPTVQLESFKRIPELMFTSKDIRHILFEIIEGMRRGLGMDRVVFGLVNNEQTALTARLVTAPDYAFIMQNFKFSIKDDSKTFFIKAYIEGKPSWFQKEDPEFKEMLTPEFEDLFGKNDFFLAPVIIKDNFNACFYADRSISNRPLSLELFNTFAQLALQAQIAMERKD